MNIVKKIFALQSALLYHEPEISGVSGGMTGQKRKILSGFALLLSECAGFCSVDSFPGGFRTAPVVSGRQPAPSQIRMG